MSGLVQAHRFKPSGVTLKLPASAAEELIMVGLTAAQMRLALCLVGLAAGKTDNTVIVEKPRLEEMSAVLLDSTHRLLAPLLEATIDMPGDELHGEHVFEGLSYDPGVRGKRHGRIMAELTIGMGHFLARGRGRYVPVPCDELRQYRSVPAIIMRLKLGAALELTKTSSMVTVDLSASDVSGFFGGYGDVAVIKRPSTVTGEVVEHVSLSRAGAVLVNPAVEEIARTCKTMRPVATVTMDGRKWASISIAATKLTVRASAPKPKPAPSIKVRRPGTRKVVHA